MKCKYCNCTVMKCIVECMDKICETHINLPKPHNCDGENLKESIFFAKVEKGVKDE